MKSLSISFCLLASLMLSSFTTQINTQTPSLNDNQLIGIATGALRSECGPITGDLSAVVFPGSEYGRCANGESFKRIVFFELPDCPPNLPCIQIIRYAGEVILDCNNDVHQINCGFFSI